MKYSIIIPAFNCAGTVTAAVESVAAVPDSEILLIDDGSTDETYRICQNLARKYPQIRLTQQENRGVSAARNRGLSQARGEYILFLDGDDTLEPGDLAETKADLVIFRRSDGASWQGEAYVNWRRDLEKLFFSDLLAPVWNKRFSRRILETGNLRFREDLRVYEDLEFVLRYLEFCETVIWQEDPICCHCPSAGAPARIRALGDPGELLEILENASGECGRIVASLAEILCREALAEMPGNIRKIWKTYTKYKEKKNFPTLLWRALKLRLRR